MDDSRDPDFSKAMAFPTGENRFTSSKNNFPAVAEVLYTIGPKNSSRPRPEIADISRPIHSPWISASPTSCACGAKQPENTVIAHSKRSCRRTQSFYASSFLKLNIFLPRVFFVLCVQIGTIHNLLVDGQIFLNIFMPTVEPYCDIYPSAPLHPQQPLHTAPPPAADTVFSAKHTAPHSTGSS